MAKGFKLGDHRFLTPDEPSSMDRLDAPKRQIKGAPPPSCLEGLVREAAADSIAARDLREGAWCGHGEPTLTVFDVVIDGQDVLEVSMVPDPKDKKGVRNHPVVVVRAVGGTTWLPIFRREWEDRQETLNGVGFKPLTAKEAASVRETSKPLRGRVSVGFEYPCDADSRDAVSWVEIHAVPDGGNECHCLASAELA